MNHLLTNGLRFRLEDAIRADEVWPKPFNCGPGALCAVLGMTPEELRPHMLDFWDKGYTNPTLMINILKGLGVNFKQVYRGDTWAGWPRVKRGLMRIQWDGPWTKPGVPMRARYRQTHWVAVRDDSAQVFDVNAMCCGGWLSFVVWHCQLVPWLCKGCVPKWGGNYWPTHAIEVA